MPQAPNEPAPEARVDIPRVRPQGVMSSSTKLDDRFRRSVNGAVGMYIPEDVIQAKRKRYLRDGKPIHRPELQNDSEYDIIVRYQGEYRGLVQYYGLAQNLAQLG